MPSIRPSACVERQIICYIATDYGNQNKTSSADVVDEIAEYDLVRLLSVYKLHSPRRVIGCMSM